MPVSMPHALELADTAPLEPARVLLVDDDPLLLDALATLLGSAGYLVTTSHDGGGAVAELARHRFDALLCDLHMPELDGLQVLRKAHEEDPDLHVLLMTAEPDMASAAGAVELRAFRYLTKPIDADGLLEAVRVAASGSCTARAERAQLEQLASGSYPIGTSQLDRQLSDALEGLWIAYEPLLASENHACLGHEALLRTRHPDLDTPQKVVQAARQLGRLDELGRRVRACVASDCAREPMDRGLVFVSIQVGDLLDDELFSPSAPLSAHAARVVLELTERAGLEEFEDLAQRAGRLRALGFRLALDELGGGYAGLNAFAVIDPELVKLDRALIHDAASSPASRRLIRTIVGLCHETDKLVLAAGIETHTELLLARTLGCDLLEGELLRKPGGA